ITNVPRSFQHPRNISFARDDDVTSAHFVKFESQNELRVAKRFGAGDQDGDVTVAEVSGPAVSPSVTDPHVKKTTKLYGDISRPPMTSFLRHLRSSSLNSSAQRINKF
ncbi:hypothetical protein B566_EDAN010847, partial [Ephemera danica]